MKGPIITARPRGFLRKLGPARSLVLRELLCLELAKIHTALSQIAATALNSDGREWAEVSGRRFSSTSPTS